MEQTVDDFCAIQSHSEVGGTSRFSKADTVTTFAGSVCGSKDGWGINAKLHSPYGICFNPNDNCLYVACYTTSNAIKKITLEGQVSTFVIGPPLNKPINIANFNKANILYVVNNEGHTISKITSAGAVSVFAGRNGQPGNVDADGIRTLASFNCPVGIAVDQNTGNVYVGDTGNHLIRKISPKGVVTTLAGSTQGCVDGNGVKAKFNYPRGLYFDENEGLLLVCDTENRKLRSVRANGDVTTLCEIPLPRFVTMTQNGTILVTSSGDTIYKVTAFQGNYRAEVVAGTTAGSSVYRNAEKCFLRWPTGIVVHEESHSCFVAEEASHTIRKVSFVTPT